VGLLALGKDKPPQEEETSGDSIPSHTSFPVVSTCTPGPWSLCVLNQAGEVLLHRHMKAAPEPFLKAIAPYREDLVVCVEGIFTWYWRADLCAREGLPFVLGHALSMQAIHGGKAKHDTIDSQTIAVRLRGGMLPHADVYPAVMRATRDLRRRRMPLRRQRAELVTHVPQTHRPYNVPEMGQKIAYQGNRDGIAERLPDPAVQQRIEVDLALMGYYDERLRDLEFSMVQTVKPPAANTLSWLQTVPGIGQSLSLVRLYEMHDIARCPRVQAFVSYGRLVQGAKASAGKRYATSGTKLGTAYLQWACAEAAVLCLRAHPNGQQYLARVEHKHGQGNALTVLAHKLARAVDSMLHRNTALEMAKLLPASRVGSVGEPNASLDR
jgi:transposase